jgi:hypothetical protein
MSVRQYAGRAVGICLIQSIGRICKVCGRKVMRETRRLSR